MTREVYARFADIDQAEAAIRVLRRQCGGVQGFRIRQRSRPDEEKGFLRASAFALWSTSSDITADRPAAPAAVMPGVLRQGETASAFVTGEECLAEVSVDREYADRAAAVLRAQHGYDVFQTGKDMIR